MEGLNCDGDRGHEVNANFWQEQQSVRGEECERKEQQNLTEVLEKKQKNTRCKLSRGRGVSNYTRDWILWGYMASLIYFTRRLEHN